MNCDTDIPLAYPLYASDSELHALANSEDPDEMPHDAAFHLGLHCLLRQKRSAEKEIQFLFGNITCDPSIYTMDHPKFMVSNQKEESICT